MHLNCPHCGVDIPAEDMHLENELAKCRACDAVFSFAHAMEQDERARAGARPDDRNSRRRRERDIIGRPPKLQVAERHGGWEVRRRWFTPLAFFLLFFCIVWDGFLVAWYTIGLKQMDEGSAMGLMLLVFPLVHVAVGLCLTWYTIALFVNSTTIRLQQGELAISHGPLWVPGNRRLRGSEIDQLFCKERISRGKNGTSVTYELMALLKDRQRIKLLSGYQEVDEILYLEQEIEERLNIRDRAMPGEVRY